MKKIQLQSVKEIKDEDILAMDKEEYEKQKFFDEVGRKLKEAEDDIKHGRVYDAREVFKQLREKYGY